jgi:hypothetical protein
MCTDSEVPRRSSSLHKVSVSHTERAQPARNLVSCFLRQNPMLQGRGGASKYRLCWVGLDIPVQSPHQASCAMAGQPSLSAWAGGTRASDSLQGSMCWKEGWEQPVGESNSFSLLHTCGAASFCPVVSPLVFSLFCLVVPTYLFGGSWTSVMDKLFVLLCVGQYICFWVSFSAFWWIWVLGWVGGHGERGVCACVCAWGLGYVYLVFVDAICFLLPVFQ